MFGIVRATVVLLTLLALMIGLLPARAAPPGAAPQPACVVVVVDDKGFHPQFLPVQPGACVQWVNKGTKVHGAASDPDLKINRFDTGPLQPGGPPSAPVFFKSGERKVNYSDPYTTHWGRIVVQDP